MTRTVLALALAALAWTCPARAGQPGAAGYYFTAVPTEWSQVLVLLDQEQACFIMTENWLPGESDTGAIRYLSCVWRQEGDRVVLEYDGVRDVLEAGVWDQDDVEPYGPMRGLRRISDDPRSRITAEPFWRR